VGGGKYNPWQGPKHRLRPQPRWFAVSAARVDLSGAQSSASPQFVVSHLSEAARSRDLSQAKTGGGGADIAL
jgi:hypothetical protein